MITPPSTLPWALAWRIARRELSARFRGLQLLLVCLFLGVGAIAAIGTLTGSIERELAMGGGPFWAATSKSRSGSAD